MIPPPPLASPTPSEPHHPSDLPRLELVAFPLKPPALPSTSNSQYAGEQGLDGQCRTGRRNQRVLKQINMGRMGVAKIGNFAGEAHAGIGGVIVVDAESEQVGKDGQEEGDCIVDS
ncbi:uncharacterized protein TRUGW13939_00360 [Talaromyces rugulosus]|uniref:Uncharacterized protein n=1 Tax=Talaromyces rugulosus TaxID=121627 RepID=A0A7H8QI55_TALRU|nr:uncharacterized protein TRUGW13939_00360 [Talaromyces rugulosus]QKX53282.1 hypothetical protein TRUGW13939_00360 [Talaromyces rugulosus]